MENTSGQKKNSVTGKILIGIIIVFTLISIYLTIKLVYLGFTFR